MLRFLYIEDNPTDVYLFNEMLNSAQGPPPCRLEHAGTLGDGLTMLESGAVFDGVLLDLTLSDSRGLETVSKVAARAPQLPIIVLTSTDDDALGVQALERGAQDYLVKDDVTLGSFSRAIRYSIERKRLIEELHERYRELEAADAEVSRLQGLIRICAVCKRVVNEEGDWQAIEAYVHSHSGADFTHGYCPECSADMSENIDRYHGGGQRESST